MASKLVLQCMGVKKVKRLFGEFKPEHYELVLAPDRDSMTFSGQVVITGQKTGKPSRRLTFHQKDLRVTAAQISRQDKKTGTQDIGIERTNNHDSFDELRLHAKEILYPGKYKVTLEFSGRINEQMHGIYPCRFKHAGQTKKIIATQFESHYAREVFPCIDEPEAKATFDLSLVTPSGETAVANTPIKSQADQDGKIITAFETTPKMSTYLLAFAFGELDWREAKTRRGVTVRTYATPDNAKFTDFALDTAVKLLDFFDEYFGIHYPLAKLDMLALPDFSSAAMENWGLVTYREQAMLVDPKNTTIDTKQYVAMVIAHELAHQWFGNLVTMRWWTDLWLNEGFASWITFLATDKLFPQWHVWTQYLVEDQLTGMRWDALDNTHPVEVPINQPDEIRTIFDEISYDKGSAVIHMLHAYLGAEVFRRGLTHYLKKNSFDNAVTEDLWAALEEISGKPVREFMHVWVGEPGYPLLRVANSQKNLSFDQQRFFALAEAHKSEQVWPIPLNSSQMPFEEALASKTLKIDWSGPTPLINESHSGFYATIYDHDSYSYFGRQIESGKLPETDRLGLISDAFAAAKAGYLPTEQVLEMLAHYHGETSAPVWDALTIILADLRRVFDDEELLSRTRPYVRRLTADQVKRLGWKPKKNEPHFDSLLRSTMLGLASWGGDKAVVKEALNRFSLMKKPEDEEPDLRGVIYGTAVREGGKREFNKLKNFYSSTNSATEKVALAGALTGFKQPEIYKQALDMIKTDAVRSQDITSWVAYIFANRYAKHDAWEWFKKNWRWLEKNLGSELGFSRLSLYSGRAFSDDEFKKSFTEFFEPRLNPLIERDYKKALETINWQTAWRKRDYQSVKRFFDDRS